MSMMDAIEDEYEDRIEALNKRIKELESAATTNSIAASALNERIKELEAENAKLQANNKRYTKRIKELEDKWDRLDATNTRMFIKFKERIEELEAENDKFKDALVRIDNWAKAYPRDIFLKPDLKQAAKVLNAAGMTLDAISTDAMRHVLDGVKDIVEQALMKG